jgi:DNA-binding SARP family transcriptional activator
MHELDQPMLSDARIDEPSSPILICLLGNFRLLKAGNALTIHGGGKTEGMLGQLGLRHGQRLPRAALTNLLWPTSDTALANQSLNSLVYSLHKLVGDALGGVAPVLHEEGFYRLNVEAGVDVDVAHFDALTHAGDRQVRAGELTAAAMSYNRSLRLYRGDLCVATDVYAVVERERLRARYLTLLAQLADYQYSAGDYEGYTDYAWRLLACDPSREDAHRVVMRCYVRHGERAAALHHYHVCLHILRTEFDAAPEPATTALFEQIRLHPDSI